MKRRSFLGLVAAVVFAPAAVLRARKPAAKPHPNSWWVEPPELQVPASLFSPRGPEVMVVGPKMYADLQRIYEKNRGRR